MLQNGWFLVLIAVIILSYAVWAIDKALDYFLETEFYQTDRNANNELLNKLLNGLKPFLVLAVGLIGIILGWAIAIALLVAGFLNRTPVTFSNAFNHYSQDWEPPQPLKGGSRLRTSGRFVLKVPDESSPPTRAKYRPYNFKGPY
jgi:hypothetical protein